MTRSCLLALPLIFLVAGAGSARAVGEEAQLAERAVPRTVRVSFAADQVFVSVRSRVRPIVLGERTWSRWDRDGDGVLGESELGPLRAELKRSETGHLGVTVDGMVVPVRDLALRIEEPAQAPIALDSELVLRIEGKVATVLAAGTHRFTVYDQPADKDGLVPFRIGFARGLAMVSGGGARAEIRGQGKRVEVATTKLAPIFWGVFEREDEATSPSPAAPSPVAPAPAAPVSPR